MGPASEQDRSGPRIGWDLTLYPKELNAAYWREQAYKYSRWDSQVAWFLMVMVGVLFIRQWNVSGFKGSLYSFAPAITFLSLWITTMQYPAFYTRHRVPLLAVMKVMLMYQTLHATNSIENLLYLPGPLSQSGSPMLYVLVTTVLVANVAHFPCMCAALPLPLLVQLGWLVLMAFSLFLSACPREMITLTNIPVYLQTLDTSNGVWARLVQSGQPPLVQVDDRLRNRSAGMTVALLTMYSTCVVANLYLTYLIHWIELRGWLRAKAHRAAAAAAAVQPPPVGLPTQPPPAAATAPEAAAVRSRCSVTVGGVRLTYQQLRFLERSLGAALLLDGRGLLGRAAMFCLHAGILNTLFFTALFVSQVLVLQVGPRLLPDSVMAMYYPLRPEVAGDVCRLGEEPRYEGWLGLLLWVMQR